MTHGPKPLTAFVGTLYVGTDRLERSLYNPESRQLGAHLRVHDFVGASAVSLRFAFTKRRSVAAAQDLKARANLRLVRQGWDWKQVTLVKALCRFVWSEHTNEKSETAAARHAEEHFLRTQGVHGGTTIPSDEARAAAIQEEFTADARNAERVDIMRAAFVETKDEVNLLWMDFQLRGITDLAQMARESGRPESEFYLAQKRRKRLANRMAAEFPRGPGPKDEEDR